LTHTVTLYIPSNYHILLTYCTLTIGIVSRLILSTTAMYAVSPLVSY